MQAQSGGLMELPSSLLGGLTKKKQTDQQYLYWIDTGATILGLNKKYRQEGWSNPQTAASDKHLHAFVSDFVSKNASSRDDVMACLGLLAGAYECGVLHDKCNFDIEYLKKVCKEPKN
jgi:hypothetical protein